MIRSKSDSLTGAFFRYGGETGMQENRVCSRCGWAGEPVIQEEWIAAAAGGLYFKL